MSEESKMHSLKTWPEQFKDVVLGVKKFDIRFNDRDYKNGDVLVLQEFNPKNGQYTGEGYSVVVGHVLDGGVFGIESGYYVMSIAPYPAMNKWIKELQDNCAGNDGRCLLKSKKDSYVFEVYKGFGSDVIQLNGTFTTDQLEALAAHMRKYQK